MYHNLPGTAGETVTVVLRKAPPMRTELYRDRDQSSTTHIAAALWEVLGRQLVSKIDTRFYSLNRIYIIIYIFIL